MPASRTPKLLLKNALITIWCCSLLACSSLPFGSIENICDIFDHKRHWQKAAISMEQNWNIPIPVAMAVVYHESHFRKKAKPPRRYLLGFIPWKRRSSAYGYAQAVNATWDSYLTQTGNHGASRTNFRDSMDFVGWYLNRSSTQTQISRNDAYHHYLAYHEGWSGYLKGSYQSKPWLQQVASRVENTAQKYRTQYAGCRA